jgi:hypothetical protein
MKFGYADNKDENLDVDKMYNDDVKVTNRSRTELNKMIEQLRENDVVYVKHLGQLYWSARDVVHLLSILMSKNVNLISIDDDFNLFKSQDVIRAFKKIESYKLTAIKKNTWKNAGAKCKPIDENLWTSYYNLWKNKSITKTQWGKMMNIPPDRFSRIFKMRHILNSKG